MTPLESVQNELREALTLRDELEHKIAALRESVKILEPIYGNQPSVPASDQWGTSDVRNLGITAAVERVLMLSPGKWIPPTAVRDTLVNYGFRLAGDNPLASIHQVLKRLIARENSPYISEEIQGSTMYMYDPARDKGRPRAVGLMGTGAVGRTLKELAGMSPTANKIADSMLEEKKKK